MSKQYSRSPSRLLSQTAMVVLLAAVAGACSGGVERFADPIFTGNTDNQRAMLNGGAASQPSFDDIMAGPASGTARVERSSLPPATQPDRSMATGSIPDQSSEQRRASPRYASVPTPRVSPSRSVNTASVVSPVRSSSDEASRILSNAEPSGTSAASKTVRGWTTAGATQVSARSGDNVASMSRRYGVPQYVLAEINGVSPNASLSAGQQVVIPTYVHGATASRSSAPVKLPPAGPAPSVTGSIPASAGAGLVMASAPIPPHKPGSSAVRLASLSSTVPGPAQIESAAQPRRKPASLSSRTAEAARNATPSSTPQISRTEAAPAKPISVNREVSGDNVRRFRWPARGRIISDFGTKPGGTRNEGINLALPEGADIKAVEDGTVIYSGNELKGYGNLVLVRHDDGWVSAYAHGSDLLVKRGDAVSRGQTIAKAGSTGSVSQPQLHFELRRGNKPVDPMQYLARL
ncbi:LysM domain-containing protein [Stappia sp. ES.058]|nr:LysM domain-containing protein [Stappia sp. ES.058]